MIEQEGKPVRSLLMWMMGPSSSAKRGAIRHGSGESNGETFPY